MNWVSRLLGDTTVVNDVVKGSIAGIDAAIYTKEEKARAAQQMLEFRLKYMEATNPQNVARRLIALIIVGLWAVLVLLAVATHALSAEYSAFVFRVLDEVVNQPASIIIGFYFLAHVVRAGKK